VIKTLSAAATALALSATASMAASFVGDTAQFAFSAAGFGALLNTSAVISEPGVEASYSLETAVFSFDMSASSAVVTYDLTGFSGVGDTTTWTATGLQTDDGSLIAGLTLTSGISANLLSTSFTGDTLTFNFADFASTPTVQSFVFDISTASDVPLPAALPLAMIGIGALGAVGLRRRKA
jgi:hypothetical protein